MANTITDYTDKDYEAFRAMMIQQLITSIPEYTDTTQTDAGIVLIELLAKGLDILSYYQDVYANETYLTTCRLMSSIMHWCNILGYVPKRATPAVCKQIFTKTNPLLETVIPVGTQTKTSDGVIFETAESLTIPSGYVGDETDELGNYLFAVDNVQGSTVGGYLADGSTVASEYLGTGDGTDNQTYTLTYYPVLVEGVQIRDNYVFGELTVLVDGVEWERVDNFINSGVDDPHYIVSTDYNTGVAKITFGSKLLGRVPNQEVIYASYRIGGGEQGNVAINTINNLVSTVSNVSGTENVTAPTEGGQQGTEAETIESIKINAPNHFRTLDRAVTLQDHSDLVLLNSDFSGIVKDVKSYISNNGSDPNRKDTVQMYVQPYIDGSITEETLADIKEYIAEKQMIGTFVEVYLAEVNPLKITASLSIESGYTESYVLRLVKNEIYNYVSNNLFDLEQDFELVKLESLVNNLGGVKYFRITSPTELIMSPGRGSYFELDSTEDEQGNNPNLIINIV